MVLSKITIEFDSGINKYTAGQFQKVIAKLYDENGQPYKDSGFGYYSDTGYIQTGTTTTVFLYVFDSRTFQQALPTPYQRSNNNGSAVFDIAISKAGSYYYMAYVDQAPNGIQSNLLPVTIGSPAVVNPKIIVTPSSVEYGSIVNVNLQFNGFTPDNTINWKFSGVDRIFLNSDNLGSASTTIGGGEVSVMKPGSYQISATDITTGTTTTAVLSITGTVPTNRSLQLTPNQIPEGQSTKISVHGEGFLGDSTVSIRLDGNPSGNLTNVIVNSNGTFTYDLTINAQLFSAGDHTVNATTNTGKTISAPLKISSSMPGFPDLTGGLNGGDIKNFLYGGLLLGGLIAVAVILGQTKGERSIVVDYSRSRMKKN